VNFDHREGCKGSPGFRFVAEERIPHEKGLRFVKVLGTVCGSNPGKRKPSESIGKLEAVHRNFDEKAVE